jgi:hypothetical protein
VRIPRQRRQREPRHGAADGAIGSLAMRRGDTSGHRMQATTLVRLAASPSIPTPSEESVSSETVDHAFIIDPTARMHNARSSVIWGAQIGRYAQ